MGQVAPTKRRVGILVLVVGSILNAKAWGAPKPFSVASPKPTASFFSWGSSYVLTGDFNGDGKVDLLVCSSPSTYPSSYTVSVFLGKGDGTFQPGAALPIVQSMFAIGLAVADFNRDGKADIAIGTSHYDSSGNIAFDALVFLSRGDGIFMPPIDNQSMGVGFIGDYNGDGIPDNLSGNNIFLGRGDGTFGSPINLPVNVNIVADFNGDGILDRYGNASSSAAPLSIFIGKGNGTFSAGIPLPAAFAPSSSAVAADVDGDGKIDLVFGGESPAISPYQSPQQYAKGGILLGNGDGTFQTSVKPVSTFGGPIAVADLNHDGKPDLVSNYAAFLGNGDGTFQGPLFFALPFNDCQLDNNRTCPGGVYNVAVADFDGDGLPDVALQFYTYVGNAAGFGYESTLDVFINDSPGDGFLVPGVLAPTGTIPVGQNSIVTAYGQNLSATTASASGPPYPTTLGGIRVHVGTDLAPLLFVSPTQINYVIPASQTALGFQALPVSIEHVGQPYVARGIAIPVAIDTPAAFAVDSSGVAVASAVRVAPDGTQTPVPVFDCSTSPCTAVPIPTTGDPVYLSYYVTGLSYIPTSAATGGLSCTFLPGSITYAGPQGQIPGMQQVNLKLRPPSNPGRAQLVPISCGVYLIPTFNVSNTFTVAANTVYISIQ
jgi:uncharacterized protein (TIGR03437 family)